MNEVILINISGRDRPGLVSKFTGILAEYNVNVLDIGQSVIHNYISLVILAEIPKIYNSSDILKDLLFAGHDLGIDVNFKPVELEQYEEWVQQQGKKRRIITMMGRNLTAKQISKVTGVIAEHTLNIDMAVRLSGRRSLGDSDGSAKSCLQYSVSGNLDNPSVMRGQLLRISEEAGIDIAFHMDDIYRRNRRLVVFDMDSTLIQTEVIDELAKVAGVGEEVSAITESAMRGEIDFKQSLMKRVSLLEGLDASTLQGIAESLPLTEGVERLMGTLKRLGYKTGVLSGGFDYFGQYLQEKLGFDYVYANTLEILDGKLTGQVLGEIVDGPKKAELLKQIATAEGLHLEQTIAVGDGANDLPMLSVAGMGIAFHAKPIVREQAERAISNVGLDGLLYLIGIRDREV